MNAKDILEKAHQTATEGNAVEGFSSDVDYLIARISSNKSLVSAIITSLVKKILQPSQDVRLHRVDFENGYSVRTLDTQFTSPFLKRRFPKYANKESSFLTLATRERIKWTRDEGANLKIRDKKLKTSFLNVLEKVEVENQDANDFLIYIFVKLIELSKTDETLFAVIETQTIENKQLTIDLILEMLREHFSMKLGSRLPVIAIYSIYEVLLPRFERYKNKKLLPLNVHTSSDKHGFGDIEIYDAQDKPFEVIEIKHNIAIGKDMILDVVKKTQNVEINRYYILTTFQNCFANTNEEREVVDYISQIRRERNFDIIANGIIPTVKYYLRFVDDYSLFVDSYTKNLVNDAKQSTEIKNFHIEKWLEILENNK